MFIIQAYIFFVPSLDTSFMPIRLGNQPLYRTHNYVEMLGFFVLGLGVAKFLKTKTTSKWTEFLNLFGKFSFIFLIVALIAYAIFKSVMLSSSLVESFFAELLLIFPLPLGYGIYKIYTKIRREES